MNVGHGRHPGHAQHLGWGVPSGPGFARGRALPIVVASGLAMGVFVGLVVVRGTGEAKGQTVAAAGTQEGAEAGATQEPSSRPAPVAAPTPGSTGAGAPPTTPTPAAVDPPQTKPTGGDAAAKKPASMALVTIEGAPRGATITIDGQKIEGTAKEVPLDDAGKAQIKVQVKASGYKPYAETVDVTGDKSVSVDLERVRRPSSGKGGGKKGDRDKGGPSGPGGLIKL